MDRLKNEINDLVFKTFDRGVMEGQKSMVFTVHDLGLINDRMEELLLNMVNGYCSIEQNLPDKSRSKIVDEVTEEILKL